MGKLFIPDSLSINWGAWADTGMAATDRVKHRLASSGWSSITSKRGTQILEMLLKTDAVQVGVFTKLDLTPLLLLGEVGVVAGFINAMWPRLKDKAKKSFGHNQ